MNNQETEAWTSGDTITLMFLILLFVLLFVGGCIAVNKFGNFMDKKFEESVEYVREISNETAIGIANSWVNSNKSAIESAARRNSGENIECDIFGFQSIGVKVVKDDVWQESIRYGCVTYGFSVGSDIRGSLLVVVDTINQSVKSVYIDRLKRGDREYLNNGRYLILHGVSRDNL